MFKRIEDNMSMTVMMFWCDCNVSWVWHDIVKSESVTDRADLNDHWKFLMLNLVDDFLGFLDHKCRSWAF